MTRSTSDAAAETHRAKLTRGPAAIPGSEAAVAAARAAWMTLALALVCAGPAWPHEYWIAPSLYAPSVGQTVTMGTVAGTGFRGERKPWVPVRCVRLEARTARTLDLAPLARSGEVIWAGFAPSDGGGTLLAFESNFSAIELPADQFDSYLRLEGLDGPLAARQKANDHSTGREHYRRCAKAWLSGTDAARATKPVGMPFEIVPLAAPGESPALAVRLLWQGRPLANTLVKAWRSPCSADGTPADPEHRDSVAVAWQGRTDGHGEAHVPVEAAGEWMIASVHMVPSHDHEEADWESNWASLTFERRATAAPRR
jgi:hypothetical protein